MPVRITQSQFFTVLGANLATNYARLAEMQNQIASGKRLNRPSDDPNGAAVALGLRNAQEDITRWSDAAGKARSRLDEAASLATDANTALASVRELVVRALNDTVDSNARKTLAAEVEQLGQELLGIANTKSDGTYLFGGSRLDRPPFAESDANGRTRVIWQGGEGSMRATIGAGDDVETGLPGSQLFARVAPTGTRYGGVTGARAGTSADQGVAFEELIVRHDATNGVLGAGIQLFNGGASDTLVGARALEVDGAGSRVRLGNGAWVGIPSAASGQRPDVIVRDENGAAVELDFSSWTGADFSGTLTGTASVSLDGTNFTAVNLTETNIELLDAATGSVVHLDTTKIVQSGRDLVSFGGTSNVFDIVQGIVADLRNDAGLSTKEVQKRLNTRLVELDSKHDDVLVGTGSLAARSSRIADVQERLSNRSIDVAGRLEKVEDVDLTTAVLEVTRTQQTLELVQSTGSRLLRTSLLDYLR